MRRQMIDVSEVRFTYAVNGLVLASNVEIRQFIPYPSTVSIDILLSVTFADYDRLNDRSLDEARAYVQHFSPTKVVFVHSLHGRMEMTPGHIALSVADEEHLVSALAYLFGTGLSVACFQLGINTFHASAVSFQGGSFAFSGESGAGKSTWAAMLAHLLPGRMVGDDMVRIDAPTGSSTALVWPGLRRFRLRDDVAYGVSKTVLEMDAQGKRESYLCPYETDASVLKALFLPRKGEGTVRLSKVTVVSRISAFLENIFHSQIGRLIVGEGHMKAHALRIAERVAVYELYYQPGEAFLQRNFEQFVLEARVHGLLP